MGWFEFRIGNVELGTALLAESLEIAREYNDIELFYYIHGNWGYLALVNGDISEADRLTAESLNYGKILNSPWHIAVPINVLGIVAYQQGDLTKAYQQLTESLQLWRSVGDPRGLVFCLLYLGMTTFALKDIQATRSILAESNEIAEANMDRWAHAFGLELLGLVSLDQGQDKEALAYFGQSVTLSKEIGDQLAATRTTIHMGQAYVALRSNDDAKCLFLDAYSNARQNKWTILILNVLISYAEMQNELDNETKLVMAFIVLSHPASTPYLRMRSERVRDELTSSLSKVQIEAIQNLAEGKSPEEWADELLRTVTVEFDG